MHRTPPAAPPLPRMLSPRRVAALLDVREDSVRAWVRRGALPAVRVGRLVRIAEPDLRRWLAAGGSGRPSGEGAP